MRFELVFWVLFNAGRYLFPEPSEGSKSGNSLRLSDRVVMAATISRILTHHLFLQYADDLFFAKAFWGSGQAHWNLCGKACRVISQSNCWRVRLSIDSGTNRYIFQKLPLSPKSGKGFANINCSRVIPLVEQRSKIVACVRWLGLRIAARAGLVRRSCPRKRSIRDLKFRGRSPSGG